jgi:hypothetical protein
MSFRHLISKVDEKITVFELVFSLSLVSFRFFLTIVYDLALLFFDHNNCGIRDEVIKSYMVYTQIVPYEVVVAMFCFYLLFKQIRKLCSDRKLIYSVRMYVSIIPLLGANIYSIYWILVMYPKMMNYQYWFISRWLH